MNANQSLREKLAEEVRNEWVRWAKTLPNPKPSNLVPYAELNEDDKEADRRIGSHLFIEVLHIITDKRLQLASKILSDKATPEEREEFTFLQNLFRDSLRRIAPLHTYSRCCGGRCQKT